MDNCSCSDTMNDIIEKVKELNNNDCSFLGIDQLYRENEGVFDELFDEFNYDYELKESVENLFNILYYDMPHFYKKLKLYESLNKDLTNYLSAYIISYYCTGTSDAYYDFTKLFYSIIKKYDIYPYSNYPYEEIEKELCYYFDYKKSLNTGKIGISEKIIDGYNVYRNYPKYPKLGKYKFNYEDLTDLFVYSEFATCRSLNWRGILEHNKDLTIWVSRDRGDGYGFDVIYYDKKNNREELIEVKSSSRGEFTLTPNEYEVALSTCDFNNTDYYIYFYNYDIKTKKLNIKTYKYNKDKDLFVELETGDEYFCEENIKIDEEGREKTVFTMKETEETRHKWFEGSKKLIKE